MMVCYQAGRAMKDIRRNRTEMLSLRLTPHLRAGLEVMAALRKANLSKTIASALSAALEREKVPMPNILRGSAEMTLDKLLELIWSEDEMLFKLRMYYVLPEGLATGDHDAIAVVVSNQHLFSGSTNIFWGQSENVLPANQDVPTFDIEKIRDSWRMLRRYVDFVRDNDDLRVSFETFCTLGPD
ncbi:hypothetical protein [Pseudomonas nitroreducens]|uniref:hypothetical protein n=1 Tax=Pseudomonas nitroreducens TaxID=46680 RepID=UPI00351D120D